MADLTAPITDYDSLKLAVAGFLNRDDLTSSIPAFISLAEAQISRRDIRHWRMQNRAETSSDSRYIDVPPTWIETMRLVAQGDPDRPLEFVGRWDMADMRRRMGEAPAPPMYYSHIEGTFEVFPVPGESVTYELQYLQEIPKLSDANTSNWLLDEAPDVYLYGALIHTAPYLQNDQRTQTWASLYSAGVAAVNRTSKRAMASGSGKRKKIRGLR